MASLGFALSLEGFRRCEAGQDPDPELQEGIRGYTRARGDYDTELELLGRVLGE